MSAVWPSVALGELLRRSERTVALHPEATYKEVTVRMNGKGVVERRQVQGVEIASDRRYEATAGQFIISRIDARNGASGLVPNELNGAVVTNDFPLFNVAQDRLDPAFLNWMSKTASFVDLCKRASEGTTNRVRLSEDRFKSLEIALPPLAEQRRIVARIEELAAKVEEAKGLSQKSADEVSTLFGKRVVDVFSAKAASEWTPRTLGDYVIDDCYGTSEKTNDDASGTPILRMGNIQNGRLINTSLRYLHIAPKEREKLILKSGDILVNRTNSAELVGKCAVFDLSGEYGFASYIIRLRLDQGKADPRLVAAFINSPTGRAYMLSEKKQMTGQANVNATTLKKLPISLPDLCSQKRIVSELDSLQAKLDTAQSLQKEAAAELDAVLPAILDKAFKGDL